MYRIMPGGRRRLAASLAATMAALGASAVVTTGPAQSAPPTPGECDIAYPVAELVPDQQVEGSTVVRGTTPIGFDGTYLGKVKDGIAPGLDMLMFEMDFAADKYDAIGIWQGMSGSPVYAADGRLVGAVAYGLSQGPSLVAGVTPYEEMGRYMPSTSPILARTVEVSETQARMVARETSVSYAQASGDFEQLPMPLGITGRMSAARMGAVADERKYIHRQAGTIGAVEADASSASDLVAGGNLGATAAHGDVTAGGIGTVTSVCEGRVVGFGHPMTFLGTTSLSLHPAEAVLIQGDPTGPGFKVANFGAPVGTITDDHLSGISGDIGGLPTTMDVSSTVSYQDRERTGTTAVSIPEANAEMTFYQQLVNHDRVLDGIIGGSELLEWTITGTDAADAPFSLTSSDRFASDSDIAFSSPWEVADIVWVLSALEGVTVDTVTVDAAVDDDSSTWEVVAMQQRRSGTWVNVSRRLPALATAGRTLTLRAVLEGPAGTRTVPLQFAIPARAAGSMGGIEVVGGAWAESFPGEVNSVDEMTTYVARLTRNDAVEARMFLELGRRGYTTRVVSSPTEKVVVGQRRLTVLVR